MRPPDTPSPRSAGPGGAFVLLASLLVGGCGGGTERPPVPGEARGGVPDLTGARVMVFPAQIVPEVPGGVDAELAFALGERAPRVEWILPAEVRTAARSAPGLDVAVDRLPVRVFLQAEVRRVGDPLYGILRRLGAVTDSQLALIPVAVQHRPPPPPPDSLAGQGEPGPGTIQVSAALIALRTGRVLWYGVEEGASGTAGDPAALASAMDALAARLAPISR